MKDRELKEKYLQKNFVLPFQYFFSGDQYVYEFQDSICRGMRSTAVLPVHCLYRAECYHITKALIYFLAFLSLSLLRFPATTSLSSPRSPQSPITLPSLPRPSLPHRSLYALL